MVCAFCVFVSSGDATRSHVVFDGVSLCLAHYQDALRGADYIARDAHDKLHVQATLKNLGKIAD